MLLVYVLSLSRLQIKDFVRYSIISGFEHTILIFMTANRCWKEGYCIGLDKVLVFGKITNDLKKGHFFLFMYISTSSFCDFYLFCRLVIILTYSFVIKVKI